MGAEYIHTGLGEEVTALAGFYTPLKELRLKYDSREVLCVTGICAVESSCCGSRSFHYAVVPGYVVNWKSKKTGTGLPVSEVDPITDERIRIEIAAMIRETEDVADTSIEFW